MRKKFLFALFTVFLCIALAIPSFAAPPMRSYYYNTKGIPVASPMPYSFYKEIEGTSYDIGAFAGPEELAVDKNDYIYILDTGNNRIVIFDDQFELYRILSEFNNGGETLTLNAPEGLYVYEYDGAHLLYICDTKNHRVVVSDIEGNITRVYNEPVLELLNTGEGEKMEYLPSKICVDASGRMFLLCTNMNRGLIKLDENGVFDSFFGAPLVNITAIEKFWRMISSKEQLGAMAQYVPTEYTGLTMDPRGFIYVVTHYIEPEKLRSTFFTAPTDSEKRSENAPIKKFSLNGTDILMRNGIFPPVGDISLVYRSTKQAAAAGYSQFTDLCVNEYDMYTVLDYNRGKIFTYDSEGNMLFLFGGSGVQDGTFGNPSAIDYFKDDMICVLDSRYNTLQIFRPTDYGSAIINAVKAYATGDYVLSEQHWQQVLKMNSNMLLAYSGAGKAKLRAGQYRDAMADFKLCKDTYYYSSALEGYLKQSIGNSFTYIFLAIAGIYLAFKIYKTVKRFRNFMRSGVKKVV